LSVFGVPPILKSEFDPSGTTIRVVRDISEDRNSLLIRAAFVRIGCRDIVIDDVDATLVKLILVIEWGDLE